MTSEQSNKIINELSTTEKGREVIHAFIKFIEDTPDFNPDDYCGQSCIIDRSRSNCGTDEYCKFMKLDIIEELQYILISGSPKSGGIVEEPNGN